MCQQQAGGSPCGRGKCQTASRREGHVVELGHGEREAVGLQPFLKCPQHVLLTCGLDDNEVARIETEQRKTWTIGGSMLGRHSRARAPQDVCSPIPVGFGLEPAHTEHQREAPGSGPGGRPVGTGGDGLHLVHGADLEAGRAEHPVDLGSTGRPDAGAVRAHYFARGRQR